MGLSGGTMDLHTNVSCTCNCSRSTSFHSMEITQLEFVQILVILVIMMMMVIVITCLLHHYRLSARSLLSQHGQAHRHLAPLHSDGSLWSSDGPGSTSGINEQVYSAGLPDRAPPYVPERSGRFQPTYPYLSHSIIDLPPNIPLSDGEEPPPYQGPCTLQLRDPEQQLELNRESVRAPPNRTIYDRRLIDPALGPPSLKPGLSSLSLESAPPAYSEVIRHWPPHKQTPPETDTGPPSPLIQGELQPALPQIHSVEEENSQTANWKSGY